MADTAMYEAKDKGHNNYAFYHPFMAQKTLHHLARVRELHCVLTESEFVPCYQPQYSVIEKKITGVEALIRWRHVL